jgi:DNA (cytosine-5)-methyltransferase 1
MTDKLRVLDLFSGIGGFSLGLERTGGFETVAFCEIEEFPRRVLAKHWPEVPCYHDVRDLTADTLGRDGITVDVITGGFPCQDISVAGRGAGIKDGTRSGLWSEIVRLTRELSPRYVIVENVANLLSGPSERRGGWFGRVLGDLASLGYDAVWRCDDLVGWLGEEMLPVHLRERVYIIAYPKGLSCDAVAVFSQYADPRIFKSGNDRCAQIVADTNRQRRKEFNDTREPSETTRRVCGELACKAWNDWNAPEPVLCGVDDGVSEIVGAIKACGNAVVPQIPEMIGHTILQAEAAA